MVVAHVVVIVVAHVVVIVVACTGGDSTVHVWVVLVTV